MLKYKAGLHKDVSAIFNGVSLPNTVGEVPQQNNDGAQKPFVVPEPENQVRSDSTPKSAAIEPPAQKPPAPSHMTPTKPKSEQPLQQPKADTVKLSKIDTFKKAVMKFVGRIPWRRVIEQIQNKFFASKLGVMTTKQKVMVVLAPVLFIALIVLFIRAFSSPSQKITGMGTFVPVKVLTNSNGKIEWQIPNPYPTTLRDPMQFGSTASSTGVGELVVKGIIYSDDNPSALIGDHIVHQGDKILDVTVTRINESSVEFEANSKKWIQSVQR